MPSIEYDVPHPHGGADARSVNERRAAALWQHGRLEHARGADSAERRIVEWLVSTDYPMAAEIANAIERGEHHA